MTPYQLLIDKIHEGKDCYAGFPTAEWQGTWYGDPGAQREIFAQAIEHIKPGIIIEVGSFVGESAIHMAKLIKERRLDTAILCVDTWYAGFDHFLGAREKIRLRFGRPDFYEKFVANVIANNCHDVIVPFCIDSINGARVIKWLGLVPQLLYIDASHEQGDVLRDYEAYWQLLSAGGGMLVDDLTDYFPGVLKDYETFITTHNLKPILTQGEKALLIKL
jgi:Predicted O-methyltransferase